MLPNRTYITSMPSPSTTKLPNLRHLMFRYSTGSTSPLKFLHPKIVRMPPPILTNVVDLFISRCSFPSPRSMLDLVWACPNLSWLSFVDSWDFPDHTLVTEATAQRLASTCQRLRACSKLEALRVNFGVYNDPSRSPLHYTLFNVSIGSIFGNHVTTMTLHMTVIQMHALRHLLPGGFPDLGALCLYISPPRGNLRLSFLRMLAERVIAPARLYNVTVFSSLPCHPIAADCEHCTTIIGSVEEDKTKWEFLLHERFRSLGTLCIPTNERSCATYMGSALPNLRGILRFRC